MYKRQANIIANATFPLFTSGLEKFDKAVAEGKLTYVVGTNPVSYTHLDVYKRQVTSCPERWRQTR